MFPFEEYNFQWKLPLPFVILLYICVPYCNKNSSAITSTIYNWTDNITNNGAQYDFIIISEGTIVYAPYASWCDGISNCFDNTDEINCGFNTIETLFYGNQT